MSACLPAGEDHITLDTQSLWALRILDDIALHPEGKRSKDSLESFMLQIGAPNPGPQNMWFSLLAT